MQIANMIILSHVICSGLSLMLYVCEFIPKLKSRQAGNAGTAQTLNSASGTQKSNKKKRR